MQYLVELVEWQWLQMRVRTDPAKFLERAAWHLFEDETYPSLRVGRLLLTAAKFVKQGREVPRWLFTR